MSIRELSTQSINTLVHFGYKPDLNITKKAVGSLREEGLMAPLPEIPEGYLEDDIHYKLTQRGMDQAEANREENSRTRASRKRFEEYGRILKKERDMDRNKAIYACIVIVAIIVIFASFLLILGSVW